MPVWVKPNLLGICTTLFDIVVTVRGFQVRIEIVEFWRAGVCQRGKVRMKATRAGHIQFCLLFLTFAIFLLLLLLLFDVFDFCHFIALAFAFAFFVRLFVYVCSVALTSSP